MIEKLTQSVYHNMVVVISDSYGVHIGSHTRFSYCFLDHFFRLPAFGAPGTRNFDLHGGTP